MSLRTRFLTIVLLVGGLVWFFLWTGRRWLSLARGEAFIDGGAVENVNSQHPQVSIINRIYYINLDNNPGRRVFMEDWLQDQPIPYERVRASVGGPDDSCVPAKSDPARCRGLAGVARSNVHIIDNYNTSGYTLVLEDDMIIKSFTRLEESLLQMVPSDWDIVRWDCNGHIPETFEYVNGEVVRTAHTTKTQ